MSTPVSLRRSAITGAGSGIGMALAEPLLATRTRLVLVGSDLAPAETLTAAAKNDLGDFYPVFAAQPPVDDTFAL